MPSCIIATGLLTEGGFRVRELPQGRFLHASNTLERVDVVEKLTVGLQMELGDLSAVACDLGDHS